MLLSSERIAGILGMTRDLGTYCATERAAVRDELNDKVTTAGETIEEVFEYFGKHIQLPPPFVYSDRNAYPCSSTQVPEDYGAYWYHPDHLGSSSYITNLDGEISQHMEYLPFGETLVEEHLNSNNSPYKFNAKEFDVETGNYYYGARYYSPKYNLMLSVDPMYELYPSFSPYAYTLQNPVRYVDPTGMTAEDVIIKYQDNGVTKEHTYNIGDSYEGDNEFLRNTISSLNKIGSTRGGEKVLNKLISSNNKYYIKNDTRKKNTVSFSPNKDNKFSGGDLNMGESQDILDLSHELFHGYQYENGVDGYSINSEVEAYLFSESVNQEYHFNNMEAFFPGGAGLGLDNPEGKQYSEAYNKLFSPNFDLGAYKNAIQNFKGGAQKNYSTSIS